MLVRAPTSLLVPGSDGLVQLVGLAATLHVDYVHRSAAEVLVSPIEAAEEANVTTWLTQTGQSQGASLLAELDTAEWLRQGRRSPPRSAPVARASLDLATIVPPAASLGVQKATRAQQVDHKTDTLVEKGFVVGGKTFSASDAAQLKWLGMYTSRAALTYPVTVPSRDDTEFASLVDAADVETYYNALLAHVQAALTSGIALKAQIAAAADQAALDAIVDNRT